MDQEQLSKVFDDVIDNLYENDFSQEEFQKRVDEHSNEDGKLDLYQMFKLMNQESKAYSELLLFDVLNRLRADGYIASPNSVDDK